MEKILNYINGELIEPSSKIYIENIDPSCGKAYSLVPDSCADVLMKLLNLLRLRTLFGVKLQSKKDQIF